MATLCRRQFLNGTAATSASTSPTETSGPITSTDWPRIIRHCVHRLEQLGRRVTIEPAP
jgi:hypothetical protein